MLIPRIGRQLTQVGIQQQYHPFHIHFWLEPTRQFGFRREIQNSVINRGINQSTKRTIRVFGISVVASIGLGVSAFASPRVLCEGFPSPHEKKPQGLIDSKEYPLPPQSSLSLFELSFGAAAGICSGIFIKKGAKAVAWFLGGMFVFLQYLGSKSLVKVDWTGMSARFEDLFYTRDTNGHLKPPNVLSLWRWLIDFLTADFQPRASFLAGFALGLRVG